MRNFKRVLSVLVLITMMSLIIPLGAISVLADEIQTSEYTVDNSYIRITMKKDGSSYGIDTLAGHPLKKLDNDKPLLYDKNDYLATSYTTIRIEKNGAAKDYVFGGKKGTLTKTPEIIQETSGIQSIRTVWTVDEVEITQDLIINSDTSLVEAGYADVKYSYKNLGTNDVKVGIRILLDTKISENDGGSFFVNGKSLPISTETVLTGDSIPEWYRISDNSYFSTTTAFGLLKNRGMKTPDSVQMGHWFNLANTLWDFQPDTSLDFADSYNKYLFADSAIALLWNPESIAAGAVGSCEGFYGIGDLTGTELMQDNFIVNVAQKSGLEVNATRTGYKNDGEVLLYVSVDNSDANSRKLVDTKIKLEFEDKITDVNTGAITQYPAIWVPSEKTEDETIFIGDIEAGAIKSNIPIKLKAKPLYLDNDNNITYTVTGKPAPIDTRKITLSIYDNDNKKSTIASKIICMPSMGDVKPDIGYTDVNPRTVYYDGPAFLSVKGYGDNFSVLKDKTLWAAYLENVVTGEKVFVDSFNTSVDTTNKQLGLLFDLGGKAGSYRLNIVHKDSLKNLGQFTFSNSSQYIVVSADEKYKNRGYSIAVIARVDDKDHYDMRLFTQSGLKTAEQQFAEYKEKLKVDDKNASDRGEILTEARGIFKVNYKEGYNGQAGATKDEILSVKNYADSSEPSNANILGFEAVMGSDPVKINRILYYKGSEPLTIKANYNGGNISDFTMSGNGDLSVINASTIWKNKFKIEFVAKSMIYSYNPNGIIGLAPKLELEGGGYLLQNLSGMIVDLQYGMLGCDKGNYTISFGGSIALPLGFNASAFAANANPAPAASTGTGAASLTSGNTPGTGSKGTGSAAGGSSGTSTTGSATAAAAPQKSTFGQGNASTEKASSAFENAGQFSVSIDSVLYGEHENGNNPEIIDTGFIGVAVTAQLELPDWALPGGGKQSNTSNITNGAAAANPTTTKGAGGTNAGPTSAAAQQANTAAGAAKKAGGPLSAFQVGFGLNTYDFYAGVDMGIKVGMITSAFRIGFAELDSGKVMLDTMYFEISGFSIDVVPGILGIYGLGGGFSDLAKTIDGGEDTPPLTIYLMIAADVVKAVYLRGDLSVSGNGMHITIMGAPKNLEFIKVKGELSADWSSGFTFGATGSITMLDDVIIGAVSFGFTTEPKFVFMGKIMGTLQIPGLGRVASLMFVFTNEYIGGGVKVLIFSGGVMYYFDSKKFRFLSSSEIDELEAIDFDSLDTNNTSATASAGAATGSSSSSNSSGGSSGSGSTGGSGKKSASISTGAKTMCFLEAREVVVNEKTGETGYITFGQGAKALSTSIKKYGLLASTGSGMTFIPQSSDYQYDFDIESELIGSADKDVVVRIDYEGDEKPQLSLTSPKGSYTLTEYNNALSQEENNKNAANMMWAERAKDNGTISKYAYISIPVNELVAGKWSVKSGNSVKIASGTKFTLPSTQAAIGNVTASKSSSDMLDIAWKAPKDTSVTVALVPCDKNGATLKNAVYDETGTPVKNADGSDMQMESTGYILAQNVGYQDYLNKLPIPSVVPSGDYIVRVDGILNSSVFLTDYSTGIINYTNPNTLEQPVIKEVTPAGNGMLKVVAQLPKNATGINCSIYKRTTSTVNGQTETIDEKLRGIGGYAGDYNNDGIVTAYFSGGINVLDNTGAVRLREEITPGDMYRVTAYAVNNNEGTPYLRSAEVDSGAYVTIPVPDKPAVTLNIKAGNSEQKTGENGVKYVQADSEDFLIEYEITNAYDNTGKIKDAFKRVDVQIIIDNVQYGETLHNVYDNKEGADNTNTFKGFARTSLSNGEHFIELIATNADGDRTIVTKKTAIDSIASDLKITSPASGAYIHPADGVGVDLVTDLGTNLEITVDGISVGSIEKSQIANDGSFKAIYSLAKLGLNTNKYSYNVKIKATDPQGNSTQYLATVINDAVKKAEGIKIKASKASGSNCIQLNAIALDANNNELLVLPQEMLKWTLQDNEGGTSLVVNKGNSSAVLTPGREGSDYAVIAEWNIAPGYSFKDIYSTNIVGEKPQEPVIDTGNKGSNTMMTEAYPDSIKELVNKLKSSMLPSAVIQAFKLYANVESKSELSDNIIYLPGNLIASENYLIMGSDKNTAGYSGMLGKGSKIVSDVVEFMTQKNVGKFSVTLPYDKAIVSEGSNIGMYRYIKRLNNWLYIGSDINKTAGNAKLITKYPGRYAVIENTSYTPFADISGRWSEEYVKGLGMSGLVNGMTENSELVFKPENNITRGEFIKMLVAAKGLSLEKTDVSRFSDSNTFEPWQIPYAAAAFNEGWLKGIDTANGLEARLDDLITREDAMVLVYRAFFGTKKVKASGSFSDYNEIASYARDAVSLLTDSGVVNGFEDNTVKPKNSISREQTAKILHGCIIIDDSEQ